MFNDNTKGTNTIGAFNRHADGTLTPEAGSPFAAGGAGTGTGLADQGAIQITPDGRFLIAADAGVLPPLYVCEMRARQGAAPLVTPQG